MTPDLNHTATSANEPPSLVLAVDQTHDVKEKLELCADNLGSSNDVAKQRKAVGASSLSAEVREQARMALAKSQKPWPIAKRLW